MSALCKIFFVFLLITGGTLFAQDENGVDGLTLNTDIVKRGLNPSFSEEQVVTEYFSLSDSQVYVEQIGQGNAAQIDVHNSAGDLRISQIGQNNLAMIKLVNSSSSERLLQTGNDHTYLRYLEGSAGSQGTKVFQDGANQNLTLHGTNSVSKNMIVNMTGNQQAIIIRNFD